MNMSTPRLRQTVIYAMECAGYHYGGKHEVAKRHNILGWPAEGGGALPDRYRGSGKAWMNVVRKHGVENLRWKIVERFAAPTLAEVDVAERAVIAGLRELNGERCVNLREGAVMTSADRLKMFEDPEHRARHKAATTESNRRLALDPEWRAATTETNRRKALDSEWRAKNAESQGSIPAAPPETLSALHSFFLSAPPQWGKQELLARAALRIQGVPSWQMAAVATEVGIVVSGANTNTNALRYIQALLPTIIVAESQSADLLIARVLALRATGLSTARACWHAGLEHPDVQVRTADFKARASAAGLNPGHVAINATLARTLARIIHEETPLPAAA